VSAGLAVLKAAGFAYVLSVARVRGDCAAGEYYEDSSLDGQALVASQKNGM
jgi:hypothetical protein